MTMDPRLRGFLNSANGIQLSNKPIPVSPHQSIVAGRFANIFPDDSFRNYHYLQSDLPPSNLASGLGMNHEEDSPEDCDFSDEVLRYISAMLMEEDMEEQTCMLQDSLDLQAAEKSFYDVLGEKYPPSPEHNLTYIDRNEGNPDVDTSRNSQNFMTGASDVSRYLIDNRWIQNSSEYFNPELQNFLLSSTTQSSFSSSNSVLPDVYGLADSPSSNLQLPDWNNESQSIWQFRKGVEEASKFLPSENELFVNLEANQWLYQGLKGGNNEVALEVEKTVTDFAPNRPRGRKNPHREDVDLEEERNRKLAAVYQESPLRTEMFDKVLLLNLGLRPSLTKALRESLKDEMSKAQQSELSTGSNGGKGRGKKRSEKKEVVDLRTLLIHCAKAVAVDDRKSANELLKEIKKQSSPFGDGNQRMALCFANGLEARLAGSGSEIYKGLISKRRTAADLLKAYHLYLAACPFTKISHFAANKTIRNLAENSMRLHIIDFGILYGFQWPSFIQQISKRPGGSPKVRITGIEFPQPGFRPAERVEETGRRLADYAKDFNVPFEYNAIAKKWENVQLAELKIDKDELLVVNCLYRSQNLLDETVAVNSSRNIFLNLIRKIKPDIFIHGIINGTYNTPFFVTRFREAMFHFSAMFDMLETIVPREDCERMLIEKEIFGREVLNVIACEDWERVERPETYKQWQVRHLRAGFLQIPFDRDIVKSANNRVKSIFHKDFVIDEDRQWLLQGWKGRIIQSLSVWKPA